jgi:hypothetical protein
MSEMLRIYRCGFEPAVPNKLPAALVTDGVDRSTHQCMGFMSGSQERDRSPESIHHRITCANLIAAHKDLTHQ